MMNYLIESIPMDRTIVTLHTYTTFEEKYQRWILEENIFMKKFCLTVLKEQDKAILVYYLTK